jgi:hypothetical protein
MGSDIVWLRTQLPKFCGNTQCKLALKMEAADVNETLISAYQTTL